MKTGARRRVPVALLATLLALSLHSPSARADRLQFLVERLKSGDSFKIRMAAALALGKSGDGEALGPMFDALVKDSSEPVQVALVTGLAQQDYFEAVVALAEAGATRHHLPSKTATVLLNSVWNKRTVFDRDHWRAVLKRKGGNQMRGKAAYILGIIQDKGAVPILTKALKDKDAGVRGYAARALGLLGGKKAAGALKSLLKDRSPAVRTETKAAIALIGKGGFKPKRGDDMEYPAMITAESYNEALGRLGRQAAPPPEAAPPPPPDQGGDDAYVRSQAVMSWEEFQEVLAGAMNDVLSVCLNKHVKQGERVDGLIKVEIRLDGEGGVKAVTDTEDTVGKAKLTRCLLAEVKKTHFEAEPDGVDQITYGFTVRTKDQTFQYDDDEL